MLPWGLSPVLNTRRRLEPQRCVHTSLPGHARLYLFWLSLVWVLIYQLSESTLLIYWLVLLTQSVVMLMESVSQAAELSKNRSCFLIRSTNQYFFIGGLNLLIFKVITEQYLIIHIIQLVIFLADLITVIFFFSLLELGIFGCQC